MLNAQQREEVLTRCLNLLREHCSNVVIAAAFMDDDASYDDLITHAVSGSLHGCIGLTEVLSDRLFAAQEDRDERQRSHREDDEE